MRSYYIEVWCNCGFQMSQKLKDKTKEDMSKVLDCSSFQIKPLQACITETTSDDFIYPGSGMYMAYFHFKV